MYIKPVGTNLPSTEDRTPVWRAVGGDALTLQTKLYLADGTTPATATNSVVTFVVAGTRFDTNLLFTGTWGDGVTSVDNDAFPGLVTLEIPSTVGDTLRRGVYHFSVTVEELVDGEPRGRWTPVVGDLLLEIEPTSPEKNIPYKTGEGYDNE